MEQEIIKSELEVNDNKIKVITIDNKDFIFLTNLKHLLILCNLENIELIKYEKREDIDFSYNIFL